MDAPNAESDRTFEFFEDGTLRIVGEGGHEPACAVCGEPIRLVLDMFSFTSGFNEPRFALAHARCVWIPEAFHVQAKRSVTTPDRGQPLS